MSYYSKYWNVSDSDFLSGTVQITCGDLQKIYRDTCLEQLSDAVSTLTDTKERDESPEVKSKLVSRDGMQYAEIYNDGHFVKRKSLIPEIKSVFPVFDDDLGDYNGLVVLFEDGTKETTFMDYTDYLKEDGFDIRKSMMICLFKRMMNCGDRNTAIMNKLVDNACKKYDEAEKKKQREIDNAIESQAIKERREAKRKRKRDKKEEKRIDDIVEILAKALIRYNQSKEE